MNSFDGHKLVYFIYKQSDGYQNVPGVKKMMMISAQQTQQKQFN